MQKRSAGGMGRRTGSGEGGVELLLAELMQEVREMEQEMKKEREKRAKWGNKLEEERASRVRFERRVKMMEERGGRVQKELTR